jgi:hypothetical protein
VNPFNELDHQLQSMQSLELLLLFAFLAAYAAAIGRVFGPRGRLRASAMAALAGIALCVVVDPWVVGALLVAIAVGAVGLFVAATMLVCRALGLNGVGTAAHIARPAPPASGPVTTLPAHSPEPATAG